jgi:hypothetical protein
LLLFGVCALLVAEVSEIFVGKTALNFRLIKILVGAHPASACVVGRIVVISALLLLLLSTMLEIVALGVATSLVEAALFLLKISTAIASVVVTTLVSTVEVSTFVVVATFPEGTLVGVATM